MPLQYSNTSVVGLSHILNKVGGVMANTPSGGRELENFTTYEAHRTNFIVRICIKNLGPFSASNKSTSKESAQKTKHSVLAKLKIF